MKKIISIILVVVLIVGAIACINKRNLNKIGEGNNSGDQDEKPIVKYFSEEDLNKFAATQKITLPEDTTTDYEWVYIVDNADIVELVRDEFVYDEGVNMIDGGKGNRVCELKGISSGETIVYFTNLNPLAEVIEPSESVKFYIEVNGNNEIAVTGEVH